MLEAKTPPWRGLESERVWPGEAGRCIMDQERLDNESENPTDSPRNKGFNWHCAAPRGYLLLLQNTQQVQKKKKDHKPLQPPTCKKIITAPSWCSMRLSFTSWQLVVCVRRLHVKKNEWSNQVQKDKEQLLFTEILQIILFINKFIPILTLFSPNTGFMLRLLLYLTISK